MTNSVAKAIPNCNSSSSIEQVLYMPFNSGMMDQTKENRRQRMLELIRDKFEDNQAAFARAIDRKPTVVWQIKSGHRGMGEDMAREIEATLGLQTGWLDFAENQQPSLRPIKVWDAEYELPEEEYVFLPRLDISASCGTGAIIWHIDEKGQRQAFRRSWADRLGINPQQAATIMANGDSMEPRIMQGDSLVIDYQDKTIQSGKVYLIAFDGEWFIKRLFKTPSGVINVRSDNPDKSKHPDWDIKPDERRSVEIIGRVVAVSGAV